MASLQQANGTTLSNETNTTTTIASTGDQNLATTETSGLAKLPSFMRRQVLDFLKLTDYSVASQVCKRVNSDWKFIQKYHNYPKDCLYVPRDCPTLDDAVKRVAGSSHPSRIAEYLTVGTPIQARWKTGGAYYSGRVSEITKSGLFNINFDDGDKRENTPVNEIIMAGPPLTTIVLSKGTHQVQGDYEHYVTIPSAMTIVGEADVSNSEIIMLGGFQIAPGVKGNTIAIKNMTLRNKWGSGLKGYSSYTVNNVLLERCHKTGIFAKGNVVARCYNVHVRQCRWSGVCAQDGALIILVGEKTVVEDNVTCYNNYHCYNNYYGLAVWQARASIYLVHPLTKEGVSINNKGGANWGTNYGGNVNNIKTITDELFQQYK
jgi:hypothetical protein